jgi:hypothetical protein
MQCASQGFAKQSGENNPLCACADYSPSSGYHFPPPFLRYTTEANEQSPIQNQERYHNEKSQKPCASCHSSSLFHTCRLPVRRKPDTATGCRFQWNVERPVHASGIRGGNANAHSERTAGRFSLGNLPAKTEQSSAKRKGPSRELRGKYYRSEKERRDRHFIHSPAYAIRMGWHRVKSCGWPHKRDVAIKNDGRNQRYV